MIALGSAMTCASRRLPRRASAVLKVFEYVFPERYALLGLTDPNRAGAAGPMVARS
jgi:hypothetical protein